MPLTIRGPKSQGSQIPSSFDVFDFSGLVNILAMPQKVADNEVIVALNVYGSTDGGLEMRRGLYAVGSPLGNLPGLGAVRFYQQVKHGLVQNPVLVDTLVQDKEFFYSQKTKLALDTAYALGSQQNPWITAQLPDPDNSNGVTDSLIICTGSGGPYLWDGTTLTNGSTISGWAAVQGASLCEVSNGTLWFSGIPSQPNSLVQMQIGYPRRYSETFTTSYPVTGLASLGAGSQSGLVFGMTKGVGLTFGVNAYNAYYQEIPHQDGCAAARTMITIDGIVYYLGNDAIYSFDGQNITEVSRKIRPWILNDPLNQDYPFNGVRSLSFAWYYNHRLHFSYDSGGVGYCNTTQVYHLDLKGWTTLSHPGFAAAFLYDAPGDGSPSICNVLLSQKTQLALWDSYNGQGTNGHNVDDLGSVINTVIQTKYFRLSPPGQLASLKQIAPELFVEQFGGSFVANTDYSTQSFAQLITNNTFVGPMVWDQSYWDQSLWAGTTYLSYVVQPFDVDQSSGESGVGVVAPANSISFGLTTSDTNAPYRFAGLSGEFIAEPRQTPSPTGGY